MAETDNHLIVGPGAIGALTCASIQHAGKVWVHPHRAGMTLTKQLHVNDETIPLQWQLEHNNERQYDVIWVCCKAHQVMQTVPQLANLQPNARIVLLHNGMGPQQQLRQQFGERIIWGSTTCGALRVAPDTFRQTSFGITELDLSDTDTSRSPFADILNSTDENVLHIQRTDNIETILWRKLAINAVINPITGYHQTNNGSISKPPLRAETEALATEVSTTLTRLGHALADDLLEIALYVSQISAANRSSMAEDIAHGRKTENDYILGYLLREAEQANLDPQVIRLWFNRIRQIDKENGYV